MEQKYVKKRGEKGINKSELKKTSSSLGENKNLGSEREVSIENPTPEKRVNE